MVAMPPTRMMNIATPRITGYIHSGGDIGGGGSGGDVGRGGIGDCVVGNSVVGDGVGDAHVTFGTTIAT